MNAAEEFTPRLERELERWLDYMSRLDAPTLAGAVAAIRQSVSFALNLGAVETAGMFDALAELVDAMREARVAMDEENRDG